MANKNLKQIALELIHQPNLAQNFKKRLSNIFWPANVALIKDPLIEFEIIDDRISSTMVLSCWKLDAILEKLHEECPPTQGCHWKYTSHMVHPHRESYKYIYFTLEEGEYEKEKSQTFTKV